MFFFIAPMFRDLMEKSPHCQHSEFEYNLKRAVEISKQYEIENEGKTKIHTLSPNGFVFHESRCGSTLVANSLAAMNPPQTRVYSESPPPLSALTACSDEFKSCSIETVVELFQNVIYLMGRTDNENEKYMFFKIQSIGSKYMRALELAFPDTPWIFVYRDPVEVMMSHLNIPNPERSNCMRTRRSPPIAARKMIEKAGENIKNLGLEEYCAVHLVSQTSLIFCMRHTEKRTLC